MSVRFHRPTERSVCVFASAYRPAQVDEFPSHLSDQVVFGHEGAVQPLVKLYQLSMHLSHLKTHTLTNLHQTPGQIGGLKKTSARQLSWSRL